jgi:hypothetical protein
LIIRKRRWKDKISWRIINSNKEWVVLLPGTKKPEDILTFLK